MQTASFQTTSFIWKVFEDCSRKKNNLGDSSHPSATFPNVEWAKNDEFVYKVKTMIEKLPLLIQNSLIINKNYDTTIDTFWDINFDFHNVLVKGQLR